MLEIRLVSFANDWWSRLTGYEIISDTCFCCLFRVFDAICQTFDLEVNDIIILSTDGLFDNASDFHLEQILARVSDWLPSWRAELNVCISTLQSNSLKQAANELVTHAVRYYVKPDDILVIMARVTASSSLSYAWGHSMLIFKIFSRQDQHVVFDFLVFTKYEKCSKWYIVVTCFYYQKYTSKEKTLRMLVLMEEARETSVVIGCGPWFG